MQLCVTTEVMKAKERTARRYSYRSVLPTVLIAGVLLPFFFIRAAFLALDAGASFCPSIGCLRWRLGPRFFRAGDPSTELVKELKMAFMDESGMGPVVVDQKDVDAAPETLEGLIAEMAATTSEYNQNMDVRAFVRKTKAMIIKMEQNVKSSRLQGLIYRHLASIGIPKSIHCLTLLLAEEYTVNSLARSSLPPPEYASHLGDGSYIHIALLTDNILAASVVISSTLTSSTNPENLVFHIVTDKKTYSAMHSWFALNPIFPAVIEVKGLHQFDWPAHVNALVMETIEEIHQSSLVHHQQNGVNEEYRWLEALNPSAFSLLNYLRIHLPELFPKLNKVIFLDDDVVVQQDLTALWDLDLKGHVNGAVIAGELDDEGYHHCIGKNYDDYLNFSNPILSSSTLVSERQKCAWLGGMNVFDLEAWRRSNITQTYQHWLKQNRESGFHLWRAGPRPPSLIAFNGEVQPIDSSWHLSGLGRRMPENELLHSSAVLHFSGPRKPWLEIGFSELRALWQKHINYSNEFVRSCRVME
ncbi:hypothetical protein J5N97_019408 [Dioscorea zingiberensis]|uniref:Hexosyltransferase n=1 Tax=Dioscorea zingiberensis TaxID=325984 RepID=A0A9D5HCG1_9LILI|nr:hypothetical protein J5N97_019408 [Dioscorea zingiberensis]